MRTNTATATRIEGSNSELTSPVVVLAAPKILSNGAVYTPLTV